MGVPLFGAERLNCSLTSGYFSNSILP